MSRHARAYRDEYEPLRPQPVSDLPLFATPIREMARRADPGTSKAAALAIADQLSDLQQRVYAAFAEHGPMTAKEAEGLPEFEDQGFSTVRKRVSELAAPKRGWLRETGIERDGCGEYEVSEAKRGRAGVSSAGESEAVADHANGPAASA